MPIARGSGCGRYTHFTAAWFARSSAISSSGYGVTTYIVEPITSGLPSCPCMMPVENVATWCSLPTLLVSICVSGENRVFARSPEGSFQSWSGSGEIRRVVGGTPATPAPGDGVESSRPPQAAKTKLIESVQIRRDIAGLRFSDTGSGHGGARADRVRIANPSHQVRRSVRELAGDIGAHREARQRRTDMTLRTAHTRDVVA